MARFPSGFWGPRPRWALLPVLAVAGLVASVAGQGAADGPVAVTALKPADDGGDVSGAGDAAPNPEGMPIEVRYGVPSPRTAGLWAPRG